MLSENNLQEQVVAAIFTHGHDFVRNNFTTMFPGGFKTFEEYQAFVNGQTRFKGYKIQTTGGQQEINISNLSGTAALFLGVSFADTAIGGTNLFNDTFSLVVNNDIVVESVIMGIASNQVSFGDKRFLPVMRPLSGSDSISLRITTASAYLLNFTAQYI